MRLLKCNRICLRKFVFCRKFQIVYISKKQKSIVKIIIVFVSVFLGIIPYLYGQVTFVERNKFGVYGFGMFQQHLVDFKNLPGIPSCCDGFKNSTGTGFSLGLLSDVPLNRRIGLQFRAGFAQKRVLLQREQNEVIHIDRLPFPGTFRQSIDTKINSLIFEPILTFTLTNQLFFGAGPWMGITTSSSYYQKEEVVVPEQGGVFIENQQRIRNEVRGSLLQLRSTSFGTCAGLWVEIPLSSSKKFFLTPEIFYVGTFTPVLTDISWNTINSFRYGISFKYSPDPIEIQPEILKKPNEIVEQYKVQTEKDTLDTLQRIQNKNESKKTYLLSPDIEVMKVILVTDTGKKSLEYTIQKKVSVDFFPLLQTVFFEEQKSTIPSRYQQLLPQEVLSFSLDSVLKISTIERYYSLLNIVGYKMYQNDSLRINVKGYTNSTTEKATKNIGYNRAVSIAEYLQTVWKISAKRITIENAGSHSLFSHFLTEKEIKEESQKAEINFLNDSEYDGVFVVDSSKSISPSLTMLTTELEKSDSIVRWTIQFVSSSNEVIKEVSGTGDFPEILLFNSKELLSYGNDKSIEVIATLKDTNEIEYHTLLKTLNVQTSEKLLQTLKRADSASIEYEVLFEFNNYQLNESSRKNVEFLQKILPTTFTIEAIGSTDNSGSEEYNIHLSSLRANQIQPLLSNRSIHSMGIGKQQPRFPNNLPEGRSYSRTATIILKK